MINQIENKIINNHKNITVRIVNNSDKKSWDSFVNKYIEHSELCKFYWKDVLEEKFNASTYFYIAIDETGIISGIFPAYTNVNYKGQINLYTLHKGFYALDKYSKKLLLKQIVSLASEKKIVSTEFSTKESIEELSNYLIEKSSIILNLDSTIGGTWNNLRSKTRNMIRKSKNSGLVCEKGYKNINKFYSIYSTNLANLGVPIHEREFFLEMSRTCSGESELIVAKYNGKIISGLLIFFGVNSSIYPFQSTDIKYNNLAATQFLIWEAIKLSIEKGITRFDMGESSYGSPVYKSKINFGGLPEAVYYYKQIQNQYQLSNENKIKNDHSYFKILSIIDYYLMKKSPMLIRRRYCIWKRKQGRLLF